MTHGHNSQHLDTRLDAADPPCPEASFAKPSAHDALVHAWDLLKLVIARFWDPVALGSLPGIAQWRMFDFLDWLRPIELMLRRLILLEAIALAPGLPQPAPTKSRARRPRRHRMFDPHSSQTWTVRFSNLKPARPGAIPRYREIPPRDDVRERLAPRDRADLHDTWQLAKRLEAAIRVACDPLPWIRRLALRIRRHGAPARLAMPQPVRIPSTLATLDALGADLGLPPVPRRDSS